MELDPVLLSRLQFAWVIAVHILLPAFTIGLASYIAILEGLHVATKREVYFRLSNFWIRIFAISFGMGVVSGVVMPFQIGTNWSRFADATANVLSPLFAYEGLMAFFLEAAFLGVLLFGRKLVPRWAHFVSALMVAFGTLFSAFWILAANSWMQTPQGYEIVDGRFFPTDWIAIVFNPSFPYRFAHMVTACYITTGFVVLGVAGYYTVRRKFLDEAKVMLSMTLWLLTALVPLQIALGDAHGLNTLRYQPAKLAAIEAHWNREAHAPLSLFSLPDQANERNRTEIEVPELGSIILTHSADGVVPGLKEFPPDRRPPVAIPYFAFRIMVGLGVVMFVLVGIGLWLRIRKRLYEPGWFHRVLEYTSPIGFVAIIAGWTVTEVGRQPWTVYGLLRTSDSVSPSLTGADVLTSFVLYMIVYLIVFPTGLFFMVRLVRQGPGAITEEPVEAGRPRDPVIDLPTGPREAGP